MGTQVVKSPEIDPLWHEGRLGSSHGAPAPPLPWLEVLVTIRPMPRRVATPPPKEPDWPPEKTLAALKKQLSALETFRGRRYRELEHEETSWKNLTLNILTHGFGEGSNNVSQFHSAKWAGEHYMGGMSEGLIQHNFEQRIEKFTALLNSSLAELELMLPEAEITGAYEPGEEYQFYKDLKTIVGFAGQELFIIDNYLDTQLFDVYMENVIPAVAIRILTNQVSATLKAVVEKFAKRGNFELRSSTDVHDRVVFADDRCWVIGQSIKDAAKKKPTYIVGHSGAGIMRGMYEPIWSKALSVIKA